MTTQEMTALAEGLVPVMLDHLQRGFDAERLIYRREIAALELRVLELETKPTSVNVPGPKGEQGERGLPGEAGRNGLAGQDGPEGEKGQPGERGPAGQDAPPVDLTAIADIVLRHITLPENGAPGKDGRDGIDGKDGVEGLHGKDGRDGIDGKDGVNGFHGVDGKDGAPGPPGEKGDAADPLALNAVTAAIETVLTRLAKVEDKTALAQRLESETLLARQRLDACEVQLRSHATDELSPSDLAAVFAEALADALTAET